MRNPVYKATQQTPVTLGPSVKQMSSSKLIKLATILTLYEYINVVSKNKLTWYIIEQNKTKEEDEKYYENDYELHLNYLIETWVSIIEHEFNDDIKYDGNFEYINKLFQDGFYWPKFKHEWLDDIFVHHILVSNICLK